MFFVALSRVEIDKDVNPKEDIYRVDEVSVKIELLQLFLECKVKWSQDAAHQQEYGVQKAPYYGKPAVRVKDE